MNTPCYVNPVKIGYSSNINHYIEALVRKNSVNLPK